MATETQRTRKKPNRHMKQKQLEAIKNQHARYQSITQLQPPEMNSFIIGALVNHDRVQLKPTHEIIRICRTKIAKSDGYRAERSLTFAEIFHDCPEYSAAMKKHNAEMARRKAALKTYNQKAERLLLKAELNDEADAEEIANELRELALAVGVIKSS